MGSALQAAADHLIERKIAAAVRRQAVEGRLPQDAASLGLDFAEYARLLRAAGEDDALVGASSTEAKPAPLLPSLLPPLISLLWSQRASDAAWTRLMAGAIASACFGEHHLWQDLGLSGRGEVTALLGRHFPALAAANTRGLRWKRYLFLRLGAELGIADLAPPRCDGCDDFRVCFPPPDNPLQVCFPSPDNSPVAIAITITA